MKVKLLAMAFLVLSFFVIGTSFCAPELEWITTYDIEIDENGTANWIIERKTLLESEYDKAAFDYCSSTEYHYELSQNISELVKVARVKTGRWNMTFDARTLKIASTYAVTYGVVTYQYDWLEFAKLVRDQERIEIGDVFVYGIFLFGNGELTIEYPSAYVVVDVFPAPDETGKTDQTVVWHGLENFSIEEPRIALRKKRFMDVLHDYMLPIIGGVVIGSISFAGFWLFRLRKKGEAKPTVPVSRLTLETEDDEEKVIRLLKASNKSLYQATITEKCGFSKTKTSLLLTSMEKKGMVKRKKKGRNKLVTLIEKTNFESETTRENLEH